MLLLVILSVFFIIAAAVSVLRIALYGGSLLKPDFRKALERINDGNVFGPMMTEGRLYKANVIAYYVTLVLCVAAIVLVLLYLFR